MLGLPHSKFPPHRPTIGRGIVTDGEKSQRKYRDSFRKKWQGNIFSFRYKYLTGQNPEGINL
eukprot:4206713-Amphidinium_carterae.1